MVLPKYRPAFLLNAVKRRPVGMKNILESAIQACQGPAANPVSNEELLQISQFVMDEARSPKNAFSKIPDDVLGLAIKGTILTGKPDFDCDMSYLSEDTYKAIGEAIYKHTFDAMQER